MLTRREEREQAFILLFEKSFNSETELSELYELAVENEVISESEFVKKLIAETWKNIDEIDPIIEKYSVRWKFGRISKVALAVLRLAVCEIMYFDDIPVGVSINEAVELCKKYAAKDDAAFVNGILGSLSKDAK
ncbi:MAG: transcription antitermination factor NusB [Oscillospiraceae bacterium]|nr:transcription antitermination factor NusB [Clostridiaceae bacterium]MDO4494626.1 transcription antitermination factor NusB [Clostridiaceae bacterium]MDY5949152.1 transcription antitermination factor NusB [Oscillospiraceae bacterium]